jgi:hypothetical protein
MIMPFNTFIHGNILASILNTLFTETTRLK